MQDTYLQIAKRISTRQFKITEQVRGFKCDVYNPIIKHSIYGDEDSLITYPDDPTIKDRKYVVFNLFQDMKVGGPSDFDNLFEGEPVFIQTLVDEALEKNARVQVYWGDHKFIFKVDTNSGAMPGWDGELFVKNVLEPMV